MGLPELRLLGGFELTTSAGRPIPIARKKAQALLAYLVCHSGQGQPRDKLATLLWPDLDDQQARANLRKTLFALRASLAPLPLSLRMQNAAVTLDCAGLDVDVLAFERLVPQGSSEALQQAAHLYRGDLLEGLGVSDTPFEEWLTTERERLRELALETLARLLAHQSQSDEPAAAVSTALRLLALDPLQEAVHRTLMRLYARHGRREAALRQYQSCVDTLRRELSVEPEAETRSLYQELLRSRASPSGATRTALANLDTLGSTVSRRRSPLFPDDAPMIGRDTELTRLLDALNEAVAGRGQLLAVLGEAGVGKSRLASAIGREAAQRGGRVLVGRSYATEQTLAYGPWMDALRPLIDDDGVRTSLEPVWRTELARLFPQLGETTPGRAAGPEEHVRLFEAVGHLLERLAEMAPLTILFEDAHWADDMSLRLLSVLSRRIPRRRILIVVTLREEDADDSPVLRDMLRLPTVARVELAPLSREQTTELVRALGGSGPVAFAGPAMTDRIWVASGGNPFVVVECLRALEQGAATLSDADRLPLPPRVQELITMRLERLSERSRSLVGVAAVVGREFEFDLLRGAAGLDENEVASGVEELVRRRLVRAAAGGLELVHDRVREVVYAGLLPGRRKLLHRSVAEALETLHGRDIDPHLATIGQHYRTGEAWAEAVAFLRRAGAQALGRSACREAAGCFEHALQALGYLPETRQTLETGVDLRLDLRMALVPLGAMERVSGALIDAERLAERLGDVQRLGWTQIYRTHVLWLTGRSAEARRVGERAVATAATVDQPPLWIAANYYSGIACVVTGEFTAAEAFFGTVLETTRADLAGERFGPFGFPAVLSRTWLVWLLAERGAFAEGIALGEEAVRLADALDHSYSMVQACFHLGEVHAAKGDLDRAIPLIERAVDLARRADLVMALAYIPGYLGHAYARAGRHDEGRTLLERSIAQTEALGLGSFHSRAVVRLGEVALLAGRLDEAMAIGERGLLLARERGEQGHEAYALALLADAASAQRLTAAATGYFSQAITLAQALGMGPLAERCQRGLDSLCGTAPG